MVTEVEVQQTMRLEQVSRCFFKCRDYIILQIASIALNTRSLGPFNLKADFERSLRAVVRQPQDTEQVLSELFRAESNVVY